MPQHNPPPSLNPSAAIDSDTSSAVRRRLHRSNSNSNSNSNGSQNNNKMASVDNRSPLMEHSIRHLSEEEGQSTHSTAASADTPTHAHSPASVNSTTKLSAASDMKLSPPAEPVVWYVVLARLVLASLAGIIFGFALHKATVYDAQVIRDQFKFRHWVMFQVFFAAVGTSLVLVAALYHFDYTRPHANIVGDSYRTDAIGVPATALGSFLLGVGMAVSGSCPGTVFSQIGAGSMSSFVTLGSGMFAALVFSLAYPTYIQPYVHYGRMRPQDFLNLVPGGRWVWSLIFAAVFFGGVFLLGLTETLPRFAASFDEVRWSPVACGMIIGSLQVPLSMALAKGLGSTSAYVTMMSTVFFFYRSNEVLNRARVGVTNWWQVIFLISCALGSYFAYLSAPDDSIYNVHDTVTWTECVVGGVLMVIGARLACGCTSGHGISGVSHLSTRSFISVATMMGGGIVTAFVMDY